MSSRRGVSRFPAERSSVRRPVRRFSALAVVAALAAGAVGTAGAGASQQPGCRRSAPKAWSVARVWDEALLDAIRRDTAPPTVVARNLFSLSAAMWDSWSAFHPGTRGYYLDEHHRARNSSAASEETLSYAAYRLLRHRYEKATNASVTLAELDETMASLCYALDTGSDDPAAPVNVGNSIADAAIAAGLQDGSLEGAGYAAPVAPVNAPLVVAEPGVTMTDPSLWQPLQFTVPTADGGQKVVTQKMVGAQWGALTSFALPGATNGVTVDPGPPPRLDDPATRDAFMQEAIDVLEASAQLSPTDEQIVDISPAALGNNSLGANDGSGYGRNPVSRKAYAANWVLRGDYTRALAEFWADGPNSETPPGHWHVIAAQASDQLSAKGLRIAGKGRSVSRLEWDVKLYFALSAADYDGSIAAWGLKAHYQSARPISMIRYMGGLGQSSDATLPSYDPNGLPLVAGLVELITADTTAPGERHAHLAGHEGEIAVYAWHRPTDPTAVGGVAWIRAVEWVPYQKATFVTPPFPGYASGHSTFSRAAAEVLTAMTGSPYFPGGMGSYTVPAGSFKFESGPTYDVTLQWATYFDAADQAGVSRVFGGIHPELDDFVGRQLGADCGHAAWAEVLTYFKA